MFANRDEVATILNALRFYCHNNVRCAEETALAEKLNSFLRTAEYAEPAKEDPEQSPESLEKSLNLQK
jgi:hypothetical protein